ncbi:hypothetical protein [Mycolicibacterium pulveris]|uniref:hypothetical protein n=1 Tax=Mycolicibacterium pulveris TaxID=36813 RepID=UPI003CE6A4BA
MDPNYPDDAPTEYYGTPPEEPTPWYRKPAALVAFGALGAVVIALIVWGLAQLIAGGDEPTDSETLTPLTTTSRTVVTTVPTRETVTETVTPTTTPPQTTTTTTTTPPTTTTTTTVEPTTSISTSTETVTQTETVTVPPEGEG